jgi:hypothetical protein
MYRIALVSCVLLLAGFQAQAQGVESATLDEEGTVQDISDLDLSMYGYPDEGQPEFGPTDAETFLDSTAPERDAVFGDVVPRKYFQWKRDLYTNHDLKLGFFYQSLYMSASETLPNSNNDNAWGQWWGLDLKWTPLNKGEDREGLVIMPFLRHGVQTISVVSMRSILSGPNGTLPLRNCIGSNGWGKSVSCSGWVIPLRAP